MDILNRFDELTDEHKINIIQKIGNIISYVPKVGVFGKTCVGKSTLCNTLFGEDICEVSDIVACTRKTQEVILEVSGKRSITLLDVPGVGENGKKDKEYSELYSVSCFPNLM